MRMSTLDSDLWVSPLVNGDRATARVLPPPINREHREGDAFRGTDGRWQPPANFGNTINTAQTEDCPMVTPDRRFLFFSRRQG